MRKFTSPSTLRIAVVVLAAAFSLAATSLSAPAHAAARCGDVIVEYGSGPAGDGAAADIRASGVSCATARKVAKACVRGTLRPGWRIRHGQKETLTNGRKKITYMAAGAGGCGY